MTMASTETTDDLKRFHRSWYWYDWANSAFVTTVGTVLFGPYISSIAREAACPGAAEGASCTTPLYVIPAAEGLPSIIWQIAGVLVVVLIAALIGSLIGYARDRELPWRPSSVLPALAVAALILVLSAPIAPGAVAPYTTTFATLLSAVLLFFVGAAADRSERPARMLGLFAWIGAAAASLLFFLQGDNWRFGAAMMVIATVALGSSLVVYDAILCRIASPDDRDKVSSRGWALGYLGGGLLLAVNLAVVSSPESFGLTTGSAVRVSMLSAGLWWAIFTINPVMGLRAVRGAGADKSAPKDVREARAEGTLAQLGHTFRELKAFPHTMRFLAAYLFFNDGIQTVISSSSLYGSEQLGFKQSQLITLILMVQFVAFFGALIFGWFAARVGAYKTILWSLLAWALIVIAAFFVPNKAFLVFAALGVLIGIVLGGSQALSRSLFSQLVPQAREAEFFAFYQAMERGTSWFGTLLFGLVYQITGSYRPAIVALIVFFALGFVILKKVDVRQGILDAGNELPTVV